MIRYLIPTLLIILLAVSCQQPGNQANQAATEVNSDSLLLHKADPVGQYGQADVNAQVTSLSELLKAPEQYEGKTGCGTGRSKNSREGK